MEQLSLALKRRLEHLKLGRAVKQRLQLSLHLRSTDDALGGVAGSGAALRIDESRVRHKRVQEITGGKLNFEPRRRADIDFVFAAGQPIAIRQIRPQLRFFYAGGLPTYMTSDGYESDPGANRDIEGMIFPDMPWLLQDSGAVADTRAVTQPLWGPAGTLPPRLFAFGFDAGQLALALRDPRWQWPLTGVTGRLTPDADRRLRRDLDWAQIHNGKPQALSPTATR